MRKTFSRVGLVCGLVLMLALQAAAKNIQYYVRTRRSSSTGYRVKTSDIGLKNAIKQIARIRSNRRNRLITGASVDWNTCRLPQDVKEEDIVWVHTITNRNGYVTKTLEPGIQCNHFDRGLIFESLWPDIKIEKDGYESLRISASDLFSKMSRGESTLEKVWDPSKETLHVAIDARLKPLGGTKPGNIKGWRQYLPSWFQAKPKKKQMSIPDPNAVPGVPEQEYPGRN